MTPFSLNGPRYDQNTYTGRLLRMLDICDPSTLVYTESEIRVAERKLKAFAAGDRSFPDEELWRARKLKESAVHPDTNEIIPRPFRMSGYVPFNGPVSVGALLARRTHWIMFWHWMNQSQNALVNYFNRNASSPISDAMLALSYTGAVSSAIGIAFGLSYMMKRLLPAPQAASLLRWVAMPTSMIASSVNCYIVRRGELDKGISVYNEGGIELGKSILAAEKALNEVILSRIALQVPVFGFPPLILATPPFRRFLTKHPKLTLPVSTALLFIGFGFGLPASIAAFPQKGTIEHVEPGLSARGPVYYNKGL